MNYLRVVLVAFLAGASLGAMAIAPALGEYEPDFPNPAPCCTVAGC